MTNLTAMTLTLLLFGALLVSAVFIILWGGGLSLRHREAKPPRHQHAGHRQAA
jgi:hypothetical protein